MKMNEQSSTRKYAPLVGAAGIGSMLGSGIIIGLSATITVWQTGLGLSAGQVGILSGALTFAIAIGSLLAGTISKKLGLIKAFNSLNILYALGALLCVVSGNFTMLLVGLLLAGFASGADLPISLTVISHDAPDERTSASLVSSTQIFWQIGVFASYIMAFIVSKVSGDLGARIVFGMLGIIAAIAFVWRTFSGKFKELHEAGDRYRAAESTSDSAEEVSFTKILFNGKEKQKFVNMFLCIVIFYVCWNLLANTFGQFQTYILVKANASQSVATGSGIVLNVLGLFLVALFASVAGSRHRNKFFYVGIVIQAAAMIGIALGGGTLFMIVAMIACYNIGNQLAGEAIYKVWTQESFPSEARASMQGFINGFSRFCCGLFALITPYLVEDTRIRTTMFGFAGIIVISAIAGTIMIRLQKKYGIGQMEK
jgi:inositol transporter-like SP family MFS transporter